MAACGPLPRPFQPDGKTVADQGLASPPAPETLAIGPVLGLNPEDADTAARRLAEELRAYNLAAAADEGNATSIHLDGRMTSEGLLWLISRKNGEILHSERQALGAREAAFRRGDPQVVTAVMSEAAQLLIANLDAAQASGLPGHPGARLVIAALEPAPPEAARLLGSSIRVSLSRAALPVIEPRDATPSDLWLRGEVTIGPEQGGLHRVDVVWRLTDVSGNELGTVRQGDMVPAQSLGFFWPDTAPYIGEAAVDGIVDLLYRTGEQG